MALSSVIAKAVATAKSVTLDLQSTVVVRHWVGQTADGDDRHTDPKSYLVILNQETKKVRLDDGSQAEAKTYLAFLEPIEATRPDTGRTRRNPIDTRDIITLPDGTTGPILTVSGFVNGATGVPFFSEVYMGESR